MTLYYVIVDYICIHYVDGVTVPILLYVPSKGIIELPGQSLMWKGDTD